MAQDDRHEVRRLLQQALRDGQVHAVLQPIRRGEQPIMLEALARFRGPLADRSVSEVIAAAEEAGLVDAVSRAVLLDALALVARAPDWHGQVAWNVAPSDLRRGDFIERLDAILRHRRFPIDRLVVEVTESGLVEADACVATLATLRARGAFVAIDDFGTGWSSIGRLARLPVDLLKIDRSLISDVTSRRGGDIVRSIISLGTAIGATVVAEGVETIAQLGALERVNDGTHLLVQGYLTGRPTADVDTALIGFSPPVEHSVCLYETDQAFTDALARFIAAGPPSGARTIAFLTEGRRLAVAEALRLEGLAPAAPEVVIFDAEETLAALLTDGQVDVAKVRPFIDALLAEHEGQRLRCCGEMVTILWERGDVNGAMLLEDLWNRTGHRAPVTIFCGYPSALAADPRDLLAIEALHSDRHDGLLPGGIPMPPEREERRRVADLHALGLLGRAADPLFDAVTELAVGVFGTEYAFVSLIDAERQWFASKVGVQDDGSARRDAFCAHTIMGEEPLVVHDARRDRRFRDNPFVTGDPHLIFYAGAPIHAPTGSRIGTVCVAGSRPRRFSDADRRHLARLAAIVDDLVAQRADAVSDHLTGLCNRRGFLEVLHRHTADPAVGGLAVVLADLDGLKGLNDSQGHAVGDRALVATAGLLRRALADAAVVARIGGDEFAALYVGASALAVVDAQVRAAQALVDADAACGLSAAAVVRHPGETAPGLLGRADEAMYRHKRQRAGRPPVPS